MSWVTGHMSKSSAHVYMSLAAVGCNSTTSQSLAVVSLGNSKASLAGSITSITTFSFRTSTGSFHWLSSTLPSPLHINHNYFTHLHLFHLILGLLMTWRTGNVSILTCFQGMSTHFGSILPTPPKSGQSMAGWSVGVKKWCYHHAQEFLQPKDAFAAMIPCFQVQLIQILFKKI